MLSNEREQTLETQLQKLSHEIDRSVRTFIILDLDNLISNLTTFVDRTPKCSITKCVESKKDVNLPGQISIIKTNYLLESNYQTKKKKKKKMLFVQQRERKINTKGNNDSTYSCWNILGIPISNLMLCKISFYLRV